MREGGREGERETGFRVLREGEELKDRVGEREKLLCED